MKRTIALMLLAVCLGSALGGCIFVPEGGYHDHDHYHSHDHDHDHD
jgi:hypothetical protein